MAQFDVYRLSDGALVVDLQADLLGELTTRVVAPLLPLRSLGKPIKRLNPTFTIAGRRFALAAQYVATIPLAELGAPTANLGAHRHEIIGAVDVVLTGV